MTPEEIVFRKLGDDEEEQAYHVICDTVDWLRAKNIALWEGPFPRPKYAERQKDGRNFALFIGGRIAAVLSLVPGVPRYWRTDAENPEATWLCTMATADAFRGKKLGLRALEEAKALLAAQGETELYLDCKPGFLQEFYGSAGFTPVVTRDLPIPHASSAEPTTATLMRCPLTPTGR